MEVTQYLISQFVRQDHIEGERCNRFRLPSGVRPAGHISKHPLGA